MDDSLEIVTDVLPPEEGRTSGLQNAQLVKCFLKVNQSVVFSTFFVVVGQLHGDGPTEDHTGNLTILCHSTLPAKACKLDYFCN